MELEDLDNRSFDNDASLISLNQPDDSDHVMTLQDGNMDTRKLCWMQPTLMVLSLVSALVSALSHHTYYHSLHHHPAYPDERQQWPVRIGNGLAVLTIALFKVAIGLAYTQKLWTRLRSRSYTLASIDRLFAITSDLTSFFSYEVIRNAHPLVLFALFIWIIPIAQTVPGATLSVENALTSSFKELPVPALSPYLDLESSSYGAPSWIHQTVAETSVTGTISQIPAPARNSSYIFDVTGPSLQCINANERQQALFDNITDGSLSPKEIWLANSTWLYPNETTAEDHKYLVYSAFVPGRYQSNFSDLANWEALTTTGYEGPQMWIRTAEHSIVCLQGRVNLHVNFSWINGLPNHQVQHWNFSAEPSLAYPRDTIDEKLAMAIFTDLTTWMTGNIMVDTSDHRRIEASSNIMTLPLRYCDDISRNYWVGKTIPDPPEDVTSVDIYGNVTKIGSTASFPTSPSICRNKTLAEAIEELSRNITLSLLANPAVTISTFVNVTSTSTKIVYVYRPRYLIMTYAAAGLVALIATMFGIAALDENEVAHSRDFSAILNATRNPELKLVSKDSGLGALPLDKTAARTRLSFGLLQNVDEADSHRMGFKFASD